MLLKLELYFEIYMLISITNFDINVHESLNQYKLSEV